MIAWRKFIRTNNEPTNATIAYGPDKGVLTFYLGGSLLDVSVATIKADDSKLKALCCDRLGGQNMDNMMDAEIHHQRI